MPKKPCTKPIALKLQKTKDKEKIMKDARGRKPLTYTGTKIRIIRGKSKKREEWNILCVERRKRPAT